MHATQFARAFAAAVRYSRDHHDVNSLAAGLPFAATRANPQLDGHRAALADALYEAGRDDEAAIAADPAKSIHVIHYSPDDGWGVDEADDKHSFWLTDAAHDYLRTALWSSTGDDGEPLDNRHDHRDFTDESRHRAMHDYSKFLSKLSWPARDEVERSHGTAAHNLWLSRNGHGAGFQDGDYEHGDELHAAANSLGEQSVEVEPLPNGDATDADGVQLHLHGGRE